MTSTALEKHNLREVPWEEGARQMNECGYLFARVVGEVEELTLALVIVEAKAQAPIQGLPDDSEIAKLKLGGRPIEQDATCRVFEVVFDRNAMVSYTVLNESYGRYPEKPEKFSGKLFRIFTWSHLLEFTRKTTYVCEDYPGPLKHFEIACLNHVFDVICTKPPKISVGIWLDTDG